MNILKQNIVFTGFRGTGKSLLGSLLAERLGIRFFDTDVLLVERLGGTISEIVRHHGWAFFRDAERHLLEEMGKMNGIVLATGGGAIMHQEAWQHLRTNAYVIWLDANIKTICKRMQEDNLSAEQRPALTLASPLEEAEEKLRERTPLYLAGSDYCIDTSESSPSVLVESILQHLHSISVFSWTGMPS